jgi:excisionase family DNA binding protein
MRLLTAKQTAEMLQVTPSRVYALAKEGTIPVVRLKRQVRFDETTLREWIACGGTASRQNQQGCAEAA